MFPRAARKVSSNALQHFSKQSPLTNPAMLSTFNHIHTKKNVVKPSPTSPTQSKQTGSRWFSAIALNAMMPSLTSSISPREMMPAIPGYKSMTESIGMLTGNTTMANKGNRVMQRVWEKRQKKLEKATNGILETFKSGLKFESAEIYIRKAGSFDDSQDNAQKEVHIALRGIAHTVVVLKAGNQRFLLDRVVEGIRLSELKYNEETKVIEKDNKFKPEEMVKLSTYNNINLSSVKIAEWINKESKTQYNVIRNNCVWFSFYFHQQFLSGLKMQQFYHSVKGKFVNKQ
mmetsp:Transcript_1711/g.1432  ORF Transcript_1711/g.1432 Transcript_1711/m.1432 type:complete len:287 (-) Transcript_1711:935-1795(-)